jgi:hypothetical protein
MFIANQRLVKEVPAEKKYVKNNPGITKETVFSVRLAPTLHKEDPSPAERIFEGVFLRPHSEMIEKRRQRVKIFLLYRISNQNTKHYTG